MKIIKKETLKRKSRKIAIKIAILAIVYCFAISINKIFQNTSIDKKSKAIKLNINKYRYDEQAPNPLANAKIKDTTAIILASNFKDDSDIYNSLKQNDNLNNTSEILAQIDQPDEFDQLYYPNQKNCSTKAYNPNQTYKPGKLDQKTKLETGVIICDSNKIITQNKNNNYLDETAYLNKINNNGLNSKKLIDNTTNTITIELKESTKEILKILDNSVVDGKIKLLKGLIGKYESKKKICQTTEQLEKLISMTIAKIEIPDKEKNYIIKNKMQKFIEKTKKRALEMHKNMVTQLRKSIGQNQTVVLNNTKIAKDQIYAFEDKLIKKVSKFSSSLKREIFYE